MEVWLDVCQGKLMICSASHIEMNKQISAEIPQKWDQFFPIGSGVSKFKKKSGATTTT